ncbi:MAG: GNAT family N-acetyltransferase [Candidatus Heimdallarchaeota archaeon]
MLKSKRGFLASEILDYHVVDQHSKKMGQVKDLLINPLSWLIDYITIGEDSVVPTSLVLEDDLTKRIITLSQSKVRLARNISKVYPENHLSYSGLRKSVVFDFEGVKLGPVKNIAYYPGLRVDIVIEKQLFDFLIDSQYSAVPVENVCWIKANSVILNAPKEDLKLVNLSGYEQLFTEDLRFREGKKRYIIVEAPSSTVSYYLSQREELLSEVARALFIEELNVANEVEVVRFVKLFNTILATSPDSFIPLSNDKARQHFGQGTFLVYEAHRAIGYAYIKMEHEDDTGQLIGVICGIGVHPSHRGKRVALALLNRASRYLINNQVDRIQADILDVNIPSLKLFSSLGFREVGETHLA